MLYFIEIDQKLEQAHNFLTDLETLREAADAEDMQDEEAILVSKPF